MRTFKAGTMLLLSVLTSTVIYSQETTAFTILEAEEYGVNNNEKMKNAVLNIEIAQKKIWETKAIGLPQISATGSFQNLLDIPVSVVDATLFNPNAQPGEVMTFQMGQAYSSSLAFNVSQLVFDGSYIIGLQFAKFYGEMAETALTNTQQEIKAMVREAYYNVLIADKNLSLIDSVMAYTEQLWNETKILQKNGMIRIEEVNQLELAYNRMLVSRFTAQRQTEISRNMLKLQMGYEFEKDLQLTNTLEEVLLQVEQANPVLQNFDLTQNSNYILLSQQATLDSFNLRNEQAKYLPSVGAFFTHSQNAYRNEFNFFANQPWYPTTVWGLSVQIPIMSSGQKVMRVQQAEIKLEVDQNNLENLERTLEYTELNLKAAFENSYQMMKLEEMNVNLAAQIYNNEVKRKDIGVGSGLRVTQLQTQLLNAQGSYINMVFQMLAIKIQLDKLFNQ
jgi:outer membrane protein